MSVKLITFIIQDQRREMDERERKMRSGLIYLKRLAAVDEFLIEVYIKQSLFDSPLHFGHLYFM